MTQLSKILGFAALVFSASGCLKDKGFEDGKYGINIIPAKAVAFPQASSSPVTVGITASPDPVEVAGPLLTIEGANAPTSDVHITLAVDQSIVTDAGLTELPAGTFSLNTLDAVIPAGATTLGDLKLTVTNSNALDPNIKYGVGLKIVSADQGYQVASNMSTVIIAFAIKNKYDGVYLLKGRHNRPNLDFPYETEVHLITTGPNTVIFYWPDVKSNGHPIGTGPDPLNDLSWYGSGISPVIEFDATTNLVTKVFNNPPNATVITLFTGAGSRISKFDPATKSITVDWNYNGNPARAFFDNLTYVKPRP